MEKKRSQVNHHKESGILCTPLESLKEQQHGKGSVKSCSGGGGAPVFVCFPELFLGGLIP